MSERHHVTTLFPTEYVRAGNRVSLTCKEVELRGDVVTPPTCPSVACDRVYDHKSASAMEAKPCPCPPCNCENCIIRRLKATFAATENDG
jgi:hypothetical protein